MECNSTGAEAKMAALAAQVRAVNPKARSIFYYTVDNVRVESDLGRFFLQHPELTLTRYAISRTTGQLGAFQMYQYGQSVRSTALCVPNEFSFPHSRNHHFCCDWVHRFQ